jgi:hypothetical protein
VGRQSISRKEFFEVWLHCSKNSRNEDVVGGVIEELHLQSCTQDITECVKRTVRVMSNEISQR